MSSSYAGVFKRAGVDAALALLNGGYIELLDGTQPANINTAITTQNVLATLTLNSPAFNNSSGDPPAATLAGSVQGTGAAAGTVTWGRVYKADDTPIMDGSAGVTGSGNEIELNLVSVSIGQIIAVTSFIYSEA